VDLRIERPETCWTSALRLPESELVETMAEMYTDSSMGELIDVYSGAHDLPTRLQDSDREYMQNAHDREEWGVTYMDFCLRRYGHGPLDGQRALEAGCGSGGALPHLARRFTEVLGIDPDLPALFIAAKRLEGLGISGRVTLVAAMLEQRVIEPGTCDAVKCTDVIEHVADPMRAAEVMGSVMSARGAVFVRTPNRWSILTPEPHVRLWGVNLMPRGLADEYVKRRIGLRYGDITRLLSGPELVRVLARTGADELRVVPVEDKYFNPETERGQRLKRLFGRPPANWLSSAVRPVQPALDVVCVNMRELG